MKAMNKISQPVANIITFLVIMISGEAFGGPYFMYLLGALPHGVPYSLLGIGGILCLIIAHIYYQGVDKRRVSPVLQILGILITMLSLFDFFARDRKHYNYATFVQTVPLLTLFLYGISVLCGIVLAVMQLVSLKGKKSHLRMLL